MFAKPRAEVTWNAVEEERPRHPRRALQNMVPHTVDAPTPDGIQQCLHALGSHELSVFAPDLHVIACEKGTALQFASPRKHASTIDTAFEVHIVVRLAADRELLRKHVEERGLEGAWWSTEYQRGSLASCRSVAIEPLLDCEFIVAVGEKLTSRSPLA